MLTFAEAQIFLMENSNIDKKLLTSKKVLVFTLVSPSQGDTLSVFLCKSS